MQNAASASIASPHCGHALFGATDCPQEAQKAAFGRTAEPQCVQFMITRQVINDDELVAWRSTTLVAVRCCIAPGEANAGKTAKIFSCYTIYPSVR
jgi:hypothetical protein